MMKNKEYIQLPALHRDISEEELLCIWEFAKLPDEAQEQMLDRVKEALREDVVQKDIVPDGDHVAMTDRINRYMVASRNVKTCNDRNMPTGCIYISRMLCIGNSSERIEAGVPRI